MDEPGADTLAAAPTTPLGGAQALNDRAETMNRITTTVLDCGMPLLVEQMEGVRSASLCWLLPAGAGTDPDDRQGLSTMWAELLHRGAGTLDSRAQADALDRLGLVRDTEVRAQYLRITATMIGDRMEAALPLLADMVLRPRFEAEAMEPTRELAIASLIGLKDNPSERAHILLSQLHNELPINRSGLGTEAGLAAITREDLVRGWERQARPGRSILAVAGEVDPGAIARQLNDLLKSWSGKPPELTLRPSTTRGSFRHVDDPSNQVQVYLSHQAPPEPNSDARLEALLASVLSGGSSSRLFTEIREKRSLCYAVSASYAADKLFGRCVAYVGTTPERAQESLDVLVSELNRLTAAGGDKVVQDEFDRAMVGYRTRLVFSGESTAARAATLANDQHRIGRGRSLAELRAEVERVTLADLNAYAARRTLGPCTIVTLGPTEVRRP